MHRRNLLILIIAQGFVLETSLGVSPIPESPTTYDERLPSTAGRSELEMTLTKLGVDCEGCSSREDYLGKLKSVLEASRTRNLQQTDKRKDDNWLHGTMAKSQADKRHTGSSQPFGEPISPSNSEVGDGNPRYDEAIYQYEMSMTRYFEFLQDRYGNLGGESLKNMDYDTLIRTFGPGSDFYEMRGFPETPPIKLPRVDKEELEGLRERLDTLRQTHPELVEAFLNPNPETLRAFVLSNKDLVSGELTSEELDLIREYSDQLDNERDRPRDANKAT